MIQLTAQQFGWCMAAIGSGWCYTMYDITRRVMQWLKDNG